MSEQEKSDLRVSTKTLFEQKKNELRSKKQETKQLREELRSTKNRADRRELRQRKETADRETLRLEEELSAAKHQRAEFLLAARRGAQDGQDGETGALPDFVIIGQRRSGTTFLYHLLSLHPHVEPAARKEPHFFGVYFNEGVEWYRRHFPAPKMKDGRMTITGEATPLMANRLAPERMAGVIPDARLIALLRNPVDRAYSDYQHVVGKGREQRGFEEAIGLKEDGGPDDNSPYLVRSRYAEQLLRWSKFYSKERTLVLKSEELYERPAETLKVVLDFLEVPEWEPEASEVVPKKQNKGDYEGGMSPETRRRLEEYFAPHNRRLYEYLGEDFGW